MRRFHKSMRVSRDRYILFISFLFGVFCFSADAVSVDLLYSLFNMQFFKFIFGIYVIFGLVMVIASNLYLIFGGHGLVPTPGSLHKAPVMVQVSYRYFYMPILSWAVFLIGGALGNLVL